MLALIIWFEPQWKTEEGQRIGSSIRVGSLMENMTYFKAPQLWVAPLIHVLLT